MPVHKELTVTIVSDCPSSITIDSDCTVTDPQASGTWGWLRSKMKANPTSTNWDGYVVTETVSLNSSTTCHDTNDLDYGETAAGMCNGTTSFTIGQESEDADNCSGTAAQNRFYDDQLTFHANPILKEFRPPCKVVCNQVYKCGGTNIGSFTITRTLSNTGSTSAGTLHTSVSIEKS